MITSDEIYEFLMDKVAIVEPLNSQIIEGKEAVMSYGIVSNFDSNYLCEARIRRIAEMIAEFVNNANNNASTKQSR